MRWIELPCESCGKLRKFKYSDNLGRKYSDNLGRVYSYKQKCKSCTLTERNKKQNFSVRKYPIVDYFEVIDTQEKAYIFGFLWADGYLKEQTRKNTTNIKSIQCGINSKDVSVLDFMIKHVGGSYKQRFVYDKRTDKEYDNTTWILNSKEVYDNFKKLGFREHSNGVSDELFNHFLRGLIDGDGSLRDRDKHGIGVTISSNYNQDWNFVMDRIPNPCTVGRYISKDDNRCSCLYINGNKAEFLRYLYKDSVFHLERKYERIKNAI